MSLTAVVLIDNADSHFISNYCGNGHQQAYRPEQQSYQASDRTDACHGSLFLRMLKNPLRAASSMLESSETGIKAPERPPTEDDESAAL